MKKLVKGLVLIMCCSLFVGCGAGKLSDKYSTEKIDVECETVIKEFENKNYDDVISKGDEKLKESLTASKLEEVWKPVSEKVGAYKEISKKAYQEKNGIATAVVIAKYEDGKVQFTLSFNEDMKLCGIYIK